MTMDTENIRDAVFGLLRSGNCTVGGVRLTNAMIEALAVADSDEHQNEILWNILGGVLLGEEAPIDDAVTHALWINVRPTVKRPTGRKKATTSFDKPTLEQVEDYCRQTGSGVDAVRFYNYYESNGWHIGKSKMKNWKAAIATWERNSQQNRSATRTSQIGITLDGERNYKKGAW